MILTQNQINRLPLVKKNFPDGRKDKIYDNCFIKKYKKQIYNNTNLPKFIANIEPIINKHIQNNDVDKLLNIIHLTFNEIVGTNVYEKAKNFLINKCNIYNFTLQSSYFKIDLYNNIQIECISR